MHYKFSKFAKNIIVICLLLSALALAVGIYNGYRVKSTSEQIHQVMTEEKVNREMAIMILTDRQVDLFLGDEFYVFFGMIAALAALVFLTLFARTYNYVFGLSAGLFCLLSTFVGGLLIFYLLFSKKMGNALAADQLSGQRVKDDWETWVQNRSKSTKQ